MNECPLCLLESLSKTYNLMRWLKLLTMHSCSQHWDIFFCLQPNTLTSMSFYCSIIFGLIHTASLMPSLGWSFNVHCVLSKRILLSIQFYYNPVLKFLHLLRKSLCPIYFLAVDTNALKHSDKKTWYLPTWIAPFDLFHFFHCIFYYPQ